MLLGAIGLGLVTPHRRGSLGYWLGVPFWGQGYATEAVRRVVAYGFAELRLHRIEATVFSGNAASARVLEKVGMRCEGTLRGYIFKGDAAIDLDRAVAALAIDNVAAAHRELVHAQEIVSELHLALDVDAWEAAAGLADLYRFVHAELIAANVEKDASRIAACRELMRPLRDAWNQIVNVTPAGDDAA